MLTVGVGDGLEERNVVLKAKPIMIDINANLWQYMIRDIFDSKKEGTYNVTALTDLTCSVNGLGVVIFLLSRLISRIICVALTSESSSGSKMTDCRAPG